MTCNGFRAALAACDNGDALSPEMRHHLSRCATCRHLADSLHAVETAGTPQSEAAAPVVDLVMERISEAVSAQHHSRHAHVGYLPRGPHRAVWVAGAVLLPLALFALRHSSSFQFLVTSPFGHAVDLWVNIAIGGSLVGYLFALITAQPFRSEQRRRCPDGAETADD